MELAPISLFVYNRLWHTQQTIEALKKNYLASESELIIFSDGPKSEADRENVLMVRNYAKTISGFKNVTIIERELNFGLAQSIIKGVTEVVGKYGRIIVLEDDMVTSTFFLKFMNESLEFYRDKEKVISIHGYIYPVKIELPETFFLRGADCWGWATWKRGWDLFEADGRKLLDEIKRSGLQKKFDIKGAYPYSEMLKDQINGKNDSWAIRWYASAFVKDRLTLYPGRSLIRNIGTDGSGTHCGMIGVYDTYVSVSSVRTGNIRIEENCHALREVEKYFKSIGPDIMGRLKGILVKVFK
ncbi:MAG: glycosyltransferase [Candidatus Brocadia sp.]|uniref:Methyltransferase n=1 Tax=Candidatus Brocadia fulgida TaxID=380242 RepID=A0A0M2UPT2_9BACT|nr:MAG: putative methyltransferase [Candidatus Brocadia fulgida]UJS20230.1 MAG: glycosyltransferase [Candidatus Brocadia sp.]